MYRHLQSDLVHSANRVVPAPHPACHCLQYSTASNGKLQGVGIASFPGTEEGEEKERLVHTVCVALASFPDQNTTATQQVYDITSIHTCVRTHVNMVTMAIKCMHKQCVPGALSPPPPPFLGTRLIPALAQWAHREPRCGNEAKHYAQ